MEPLSTQPSCPLFEQFLAERQYLKNVTPKTLAWYVTSFQSYQKAQPATALPSKASLHAWVIALRERGLRPVSCNTYIKALNAFWLRRSETRPVRRSESRPPEGRLFYVV
jgi:hypothetical protein